MRNVHVAWWHQSHLAKQGHVYLRSEEGAIEGWASYTPLASSPGERVRLTVTEMISASPVARRALWNVLLGFDIASEIVVQRIPTDDPIFRMLAEPGEAQMSYVESPWLRIIDVPAALTSRTYGREISVTLAVRDPVLQANNGVFHLSADTNTSECTRVRQDEDIAIDVADLASVFTGHTSFRQLHGAGAVEVTDVNVLPMLDAAFSVATRPYCSLFVV